VVGAGIAGLGTAWLLDRQGHAVTLFEANDYAGGHTHTVDVTLEGIRHPVDTGFLVFNDRTYPKLVALLDELGVASVASQMSFSCRVDDARLEWAGTNVATLLAQPRNALRPAFHRMLGGILRFNRETSAMLRGDDVPPYTLCEFLDRGRYGAPFRDWYLLPMAAAIWSAPKKDILDFPFPAFVRFCHNHGLLQIADRPRWRTVVGGARTYVDKIVRRLPDVRLATPVRRLLRVADGVEIDSPQHSSERFDEVVLACHADQTLRLLADPSPAETRMLEGTRFQSNRVVLHTDASLLPRRRRAWSAWNYLAAADPHGTRPVAVSYLIGKLQPLPFRTPVIVTLNPPFEPARRSVIDEFEYAHPLLDGRALATRHDVGLLQGARRTWYAGAWLGYGFHEDGLQSAHAVADGIAHRGADSKARIAA
jgi:uncharacterized protein